MICVSLFSGIGGIDIAAHAAGFRTVAFVERDRFCRAVLAHHWPSVPQFDDVVTFGSDHATEFVGADLLHGGFPCQDISAAGLGAGLSGTRSGLWFAMLDCIGRIRPRFVLAENVGALRSRGIDTVLGGLESAGYAANALVVAAEDMGAPHRRERVFIVGERVEYVDGGICTDGRSDRRRDIQRQVLPQAGRAQAPDGPSGPGHRNDDMADTTASHRECVAGRDGEFLAISGSASRGVGQADATGEQDGRRVLRGLQADTPAGCAVADADRAGREQLRGAEPGGEELAPSERSSRRHPQSRLGRGADGFPAGLDGCTRPAWPARPGEAQHEWEPPRLTTKGGRGTNRAARLKALGNAVVPAQCYPILAAMAGRLREEATR
jgi:DNA (cytosine-5)-methyltransferase 1